MNPYFDGKNVHANSEEEAFAFMQGMEKGKELEREKKKKVEPIEHRLVALDEALERLFIGKKVDFKNRYIMAREFANDLKVKISSEELRLRVWDARKRLKGNNSDYSKNDVIQAPPHAWSWENIIMMSDTNLLSASPKVGKTTLIVEMLGKWAMEAEDFLGFKFTGKCPKIILIGTDMPNARWMPLLNKFGLAEKLSDTSYKFLDPIISYFSSDRPLHLDDQGLSKIADIVEKNPNCLLLLDSYSRCCPHGIDEKSNYFSQPLMDLMEVTSPLNVTNIIIHHSGTEGATSNSAVRASRGHSSLPASVSQTLGMRWHNKEEDIEDKRIVFHTEGRGDEGILLIVEQNDYGFELKGTFAEVMQSKKLEKIINGLTERQQDVYQIIEEHPIDFITPTELSKKVEFAEKDKTNLDICRRVLDQLVNKKLVEKEKGSGDKHSIENRYRRLH